MSSCDSDARYSSDVDEDENEVEAIQIWRHARTSQKKQCKRKSIDALDAPELLEHRMQALEDKLQACKDVQDREVLADLGAWLAHSGAPETVLNTEKVAPDEEVPIACTLQDVVEKCNTRHEGDLIGAPDLLVLLPDAEKVEVHALQLLVRALSAAQTSNPGFVPALVLGIATHPSLLHPQMDPRILGRLRPAEFCMPRQVDSLGKYMVQLQHDLEVPEVLLGPRICSYLADAVKLYDHRCDVMSQALRFSVTSHHLASPKGQLLPALKTGDRSELRAALKQFQQDEPQTHKILETEALVAGLEPVPEAKTTRRSSKSSRNQSTGKKSEALLTALMGLHQALIDWQLCLHWVQLAATASSQQLDWWHLATACPSPSFVHNPGAVCIDRVPDGGPNKSRRLETTPLASSRMREAYFSDEETGKKITTILSEVSKLSDEQIKALISQLVAKTDSCAHGRCGKLKEPLARLELLMKEASKAEKLSDRSSDGEQASDDELHDIQPPKLVGAEGGIVDANPLRITGAGSWCSSDDEELENAPAPGQSAKSNSDTPAEAGAVCIEGSPMRITGAGDGGGWPGCYDGDDTSSAELNLCQQALEEKRTRSGLQRVIAAQQNTPSQADAFTRGSRTGAKVADGPSSVERSPFQTHSAMQSSPAAMQQQKPGVGAAIHQSKKNLPKFTAAMHKKCFSASGTCETSQTAVGVSAALPPLPRRSPLKQRNSSAAGGMGSSVDEPAKAPHSAAENQQHAVSERHAQASCGTHVAAKSHSPSKLSSPSAKVAGAVSAAMPQPSQKRRRSSRVAPGIPSGSVLEPVPEDSVAMCPEGAYHCAAAEATAMASGVTPKKASTRSPLQNASTPSLEHKNGDQRNGTPSQVIRTPSSGPAGTKGSPGSLRSTPTSIRRTPGQSMGKFLLQQARTPGQAGVDEDDQGLQTRAAVNVDSLAFKVSRVLREAWLHVLQTHPSTLPCASVLCYDDAYALRRAMHPSATADMHAVLSNPSQYLGQMQKANGFKSEASSEPSQPVTCLAYQLLRGYGETVDVGDWFASFCLARGAKSSYDGKPERKRGRTGKTPAKRRKKMKTVERTADQAGPSSQPPPDDHDNVEEPPRYQDDCLKARCVQKLQSAVDVAAAADDLPQLTAMFCHAVAELEVMGYLQRGKRKGPGKMQRTLFPPPVVHS